MQRFNRYNRLLMMGFALLASSTAFANGGTDIKARSEYGVGVNNAALQPTQPGQTNSKNPTNTERPPTFGLGVALFSTVSPYRGYKGDSSRVLPSVIYLGARLKILGPQVQWQISEFGTHRLSLLGQYRFATYKEEDSTFLQGLGDREDTLLAGVLTKSILAEQVELQIRYLYDVLDRIGGASADMGISRSWQLGRVRVTPRLQLNYLSQEMANHDYGVSADRPDSFRAEYNLDSSINEEIGVGMFYMINRNWMVMGDFYTRWLDEEISNSPLVDETRITGGFVTVNYRF